MTKIKKYYWLKLKSDFFTSKAMKKLRKIAGGDTHTIIYLKLQLLSLKDEGTLYYEGIEETFYEEMALALDEDPENVRITLLFLENAGLIKKKSDTEYILTEVPYLIGSEGDSAERVRRYRGKKALQCNADVTESNALVTKCNTEIEIEKEKEKRESREEGSDRVTFHFTPPTLEEVETYAKERDSIISPSKFYNYYSANGWMIGKNKMYDWRAAFKTWEEKDKGDDYTQMLKKWAEG